MKYRIIANHYEHPELIVYSILNQYSQVNWLDRYMQLIPQYGATLYYVLEDAERFLIDAKAQIESIISGRPWIFNIRLEEVE